MQKPIIVTNKDMFTKKTGLSQIEIMGMRHYLDEYLKDAYEDFAIEQPISADNYFQTAYSDSQLNCCGEATLPGAPEGAPEYLPDVPVSHFFLTENHVLIAVFFVGDDEDEVFVRMN